jgi:hypothetical protein
MWRMRRKRKEEKKPKNRIFQQKSVHMNRPFIVSVNLCCKDIFEFEKYLHYCYI